MVDVAGTAPGQAQPARSGVREALSRTEIDLRLFGMLAALAVILIGFHIMSGGTFLKPANMVTLAVQASGTAIMATGMVLIIVSRNIDLSVGSIVGVVAMVYSVFALYASGPDAVMGGVLVLGLAYIIWGFIAPRFSLPSVAPAAMPRMTPAAPTTPDHAPPIRPATA